MYSDFRTKIQPWLDRGESVQIVAPPGFGKSRFGKSLGGLFLDTNLLQSPHELLEAIKTSSERKLIIFDSLDQILDISYQSIFKYLKALRDSHKYQLAYVFLTHKPIGPEFQSILDDLYEIATEHIDYLPVLDPSEYDLFGFVPTPKQLTDITLLSGGIPALVKICVISMRDHISLDPKDNPKLTGQLEEMLTSSPSHPSYTHSRIVQDYLSSRKSTDLSAAETRLLDLFQSHPNQLITKDQICGSVYPDVKNYAGVTDHAIDQLIHRLRTKIKDKYSITTHRGLGYKLIL